ncbi:DUF3983 domain-containing protein [Bacillus thuringiensis]|nr:DUF3983 domain-containing protein [Bacillus thuringiensis]MDY8165897.1 DUF3983 domain-containing protein [Bacillus thuringiensis]MED3580376.1 DUF3983 domain-containing protein [Bacillus thuringiensis]HDR5274828.1 DUF3983 domain-containing protein [Bacillus thuringiensis]
MKSLKKRKIKKKKIKKAIARRAKEVEKYHFEKSFRNIFVRAGIVE